MDRTNGVSITSYTRMDKMDMDLYSAPGRRRQVARVEQIAESQVV